MLGIRTYRDRLCWAVVEGVSRANATVANHGIVSIPSGSRDSSLAWVRREIAALVEQEQPEAVALCPAEGATANTALVERAQVDGVALEVLHTLGVLVEARKTATIRSGFGSKNSQQFESALAHVPATANIPKTSARREPVVAAVSLLS